MSNDTDFFEPSIPTGRGGYRPNAGGKKAADRGDVIRDAEGRTPYQRYEIGRGEKELQLARQARVKADLEEGKVVDREMVRQACAKAFATCAQSLDAIGDNLERELGVSPEIAQKVTDFINEAKAQLALDLEAAHKGNDAFFD